MPETRAGAPPDDTDARDGSDDSRDGPSEAVRGSVGTAPDRLAGPDARHGRPGTGGDGDG